MIAFAAAFAFAGYGDPVDGHPNAEERETHAWTNAARVDPEAFGPDYPCGLEVFSDYEKTPKWPLLWEAGLNEAARYHSQDMYDTNTFSHDSSDGTPFAERVSRWYASGFVGENIAMGYPTPFSAVIEGWMCSAGHRANIMNGDWEELGTGVISTYYTQDFGARGVNQTEHPIRMAATTPANPVSDVTFMVDWYDPNGFGPTNLTVYLDGEALPTTLTWGREDMGMFTATATLDGGCHTWWAEGTLATGRTELFPETGTYGFGPCDFDDADAQWSARADIELFADDGILRSWKRGPFGCEQAPAGWPALAALALLRRRRR